VLTVAAIAWGSLSLILLLSFGEGLRRELYRGTRGMGSNLAILWPGETGRIWEGLPAGRPIRPRIEDVALLKQRIPGLRGVAGEIHEYQTVVSSETSTVTTRVIGVSLAYGELRNQIPRVGGRFLNPLDERLRRRVVFIGDQLAEDLFGEEAPEGRTIELNNVPYTVVGVMVPKLMVGNYGGMDEDHAIIPITTFEAQFGRNRLSNLVLSPTDPGRMAEVLARLHEVLGAKYGFDPEDERVFGIWDTVETAGTMVSMLVGIQLFLGIIGGMTLVVGGIGVANIMYAVVKERTVEIGVKMALGARRAWITGPIVLEGLLYTLFGGLLGLIMAVGVILALGALRSEGSTAVQLLGQPTLSLPIGLGAAAILGLMGLLAGYFPARRAASVEPAETLRYE
jgi:putative ABC transport system permease protein